MRTTWTIAAVLVILMTIAGGVVARSWIRRGFSARDQPSALERLLVRRVRAIAVPRHAKDTPNPIALTPAVLADARAHFADHCATCHANDGSGHTEIGQNLYPKAPDMRLPDTQNLTDGELFYVIHNGIRLTGMPAWGEADEAADRDSWKLVHFVRHLPALTAAEIAEMEALNPKSPSDLQEEQDDRNFLNDSAREPSNTGDEHTKTPSTAKPKHH
jgi:mono/diheme cytochrome c family protein